VATLNSAQQQAVQAGDGPVLVLAGAGTGKTRVIVERLDWLIEERGIDPRNLLAVTFTNRAANEMKERLAKRLGVERSAAWVGTFHAFGLYVLRREIDKLGRPKAFTIFDDTDQLSLMKRLIKGLSGQHEKVSPREALEWISRKKQGIAIAEPETPDVEETCQKLWGQYDQALIAASALDFDDLLVLREKYQRRYLHVLVDEYQDTNRVQYRIAKLLTDIHRNLFVVGDEDQSIYSWRGAEVRNILDFEKDFTGARVFRLEENYRSTKPILAAANAVVKNNRHRLGKELWTSADRGDLVRFYLARNAEDEARFVAEDLSRGVDLREAAILYRTNGQARVIEEALRRKSLPYVVIGGIRFYGRKEIKDLLAYLRLLVNPGDDEAVRRVLNVPPRGIGATTMERLEEYAAARGMPLLTVLRDIDRDQTILPRARESAGTFVHLIDDLALEAKTAPLPAVVEALLERTSYREFIKGSDEKDYRARLEVVEEFVAACRQYKAKGEGALLEFLQELSLLSEVDNWDTQTGAVALMTCHSAKGLEFDHVYLLGLEEGLLPHATAKHADEELEEERRLCYVAMTRARKRLTLTAAQERFLYSETESYTREVSRFVREIPPTLLEVVREEGAVPAHAAAVRPTAARPELGSAGTTGAVQLKLGTRVRHPRFGEGQVMYTSGSGKALKARIRFRTGKVAMFVIDKTPLEIIEEKGR
jgi:DNA helicase-2/ATP-dependent DNA helicase PcrA